MANCSRLLGLLLACSLCLHVQSQGVETSVETSAEADGKTPPGMTNTDTCDWCGTTTQLSDLFPPSQQWACNTCKVKWPAVLSQPDVCEAAINWFAGYGSKLKECSCCGSCQGPRNPLLKDTSSKLKCNIHKECQPKCEKKCVKTEEKCGCDQCGGCSNVCTEYVNVCTFSCDSTCYCDPNKKSSECVIVTSVASAMATAKGLSGVEATAVATATATATAGDCDLELISAAAEAAADAIVTGEGQVQAEAIAEAAVEKAKDVKMKRWQQKKKNGKWKKGKGKPKPWKMRNKKNGCGKKGGKKRGCGNGGQKKGQGKKKKNYKKHRMAGKGGAKGGAKGKKAGMGKSG